MFSTSSLNFLCSRDLSRVGFTVGKLFYDIPCNITKDKYLDELKNKSEVGLLNELIRKDITMIGFTSTQLILINGTSFRLVQYQNIDPEGLRFIIPIFATEEDGEDVVYMEAKGTQMWKKDGKLHREGDNPAIIYSNCTKVWYLNAILTCC